MRLISDFVTIWIGPCPMVVTKPDKAGNAINAACSQLITDYETAHIKHLCSTALALVRVLGASTKRIPSHP